MEYKEFQEEYEDLLYLASEGLKAILLSEDRTSKHAPYTWKNEDLDEHLIKASRHILTAMAIKKGYQKSDGENHLHNALTRLVMALGVENSWNK